MPCARRRPASTRLTAGCAASCRRAACLQFGNGYGVGAVVVVYATGQIVESVILTPRLVGERIGLHPLAVIFAVLAFGKLFGFFGVLLALRATAVFALALRELSRSYLTSALYRGRDAVLPGVRCATRFQKIR